MWRKRVLSCLMAAVLLLGLLAQAVFAAGTGVSQGQNGPDIPLGREISGYLPERDGYYGYVKIGGERLLLREGAEAGYLPVLVFEGDVYAEVNELAKAAGLSCIREEENKVSLGVLARNLDLTAGSGKAVYTLRADESWDDVLLARVLGLEAAPFIFGDRFYVPVAETLGVLGVESTVKDSEKSLTIGEAKRNIFDLAAELYGEEYRTELDESFRKLDRKYGGLRSALLSWFSGGMGFFGRLMGLFKPAQPDTEAADELVAALAKCHEAGLAGKAAEDCAQAVYGYLLSRLTKFHLVSRKSMTRAFLLLMSEPSEKDHLADLRLASEARGKKSAELEKLLPGTKTAGADLSAAVTPLYIKASGRIITWATGAPADGTRAEFFCGEAFCGRLEKISGGSFEDVYVPLPGASGFQANITRNVRLYATMETPGTDDKVLIYSDTSIGKTAPMPEARLGLKVSGLVDVLGSSTPVGGVTVKLYRIDAGTRVLLGSQVSGADGRYTFNNVPYAEEYLLRAEKNGFSTEAGFLYTAGYSGVPSLYLPGAMQGVVKAGDSLQGLPHVRVIMSRGGRSYTAITDRYGRYSLDGLAAGNYIISYTKPGYRSASTTFFVSQAASTMLMGDILLAKETPTKDATIRMSSVYDTLAGSTKIVSAEIRTEGEAPDANSVIWTVDAPETSVFWGDNVVRKVRNGYYIVSRTLTLTEPGEYEVAAGFGGRTSSDIFRVEPGIGVRCRNVDGFLELRVEAGLETGDAAFLENFLKSIRTGVTASSGSLGFAGERLEITGDGRSGALVMRLKPEGVGAGTTVNIVVRTKAGQIASTSAVIGSVVPQN